jgi:hypothetical protein
VIGHEIVRALRAVKATRGVVVGLVPLLSVVLPALAIASARAPWVEARARGVGAIVGGGLAALAPARAAPREDDDLDACDVEAPDLAEEAAPPRSDGEPLAGKAPKKPSKKKAARAAVPTRGVYVDARTVLRLSRRGIVPAGSPVRATSSRPAGLALAGVSALGVGLSDGDVLVEVEGSPVRTEGQVIGMVIAARGRRVPHLSAIFFRGAEPMWLTVEMPYIVPRPAPASSVAQSTQVHTSPDTTP